MAMRSRTPGRREWTSLSVLAGAALTGTPATAFATIVSHGPAAFPVSLPGAHAITLRQSGSYFVDTNQFPFGNGATRFATEIKHTYNAGLQGVTFAAHFAVKGQTFNQIGSDRYQSFVARRKISTFKNHMTARTNASHRNLSTLRQFIRSHMPYETRNYVTSILGTAHHQTGIRVSGSRIVSSTNPSPYSNAYALFRFDVGSQTDYGWLKLSLSYPPTGGPDFTISAYAYDTSGRPIPAGFVPEPQELPLAMSALALGALGMREWRKGRGKSTGAR